MAKPPVLKSKEVVAILEKLGFVESGSAVLIDNIVITMDGEQQFLFMQGVIFLQSSYDKS